MYKLESKKSNEQETEEKKVVDPKTQPNPAIDSGEYSVKFLQALINLAKGKILDDQLEDVKKFYSARRSFVKGMDINDQKVQQHTQASCNELAIKIQSDQLKEVENECKSRNLDVKKIMPFSEQLVYGDMTHFVEIERFFALKVLSENLDKEITISQIKDYICYSYALSHKLQNGTINPDLMILLPHVLSDNLYNKTGQEGEEVVYKVQQYLQKDELPEDVVNLIIKEGYAVEKGKEKSFKAFEEQMKKVNDIMAKAQQQPLPPPEHLKMMGLPPDMTQDQFNAFQQEVIQMQAMGMLPNMGPGMPPPGMPPPGMPLIPFIKVF